MKRQDMKMNQRKNSGVAVLLYNLDGSERARKIKFILVRMGVRIKNIKKEDYLKPIGALAGVPGIEPGGSCYDGPGFTEEMLVMKGMTMASTWLVAVISFPSRINLPESFW